MPGTRDSPGTCGAIRFGNPGCPCGGAPGCAGKPGGGCPARGGRSGLWWRTGWRQLSRTRRQAGLSGLTANPVVATDRLAAAGPAASSSPAASRLVAAADRCAASYRAVAAVLCAASCPAAADRCAVPNPVAAGPGGSVRRCCCPGRFCWPGCCCNCPGRFCPGAPLGRWPFGCWPAAGSGGSD